MIRTNIQATWKTEGWNVQTEAQMSMEQNKKLQYALFQIQMRGVKKMQQRSYSKI